jgi:hypothetical protein
MADGANVTPIVHFAPGPTPELQPLLASPKSPLVVTDDITKFVLRWFVRVTVFAALVAPTSVFGNTKLVGATVTGVIPTPDRATDCEPEEELLLTVNSAIRFPRADGVNVTVMPQLRPGPSVLGLIGQFPPQL